MNGQDYWVPMRSRHTDAVWVEGPYNYDEAKRKRKSALGQLEGEAEIGTPIAAKTKAEAQELALKRMGKSPS